MIDEQDVLNDIDPLIDVKLHKNASMKASPEKAGKKFCDLKSSQSADVSVDGSGQKINV
jgi:hypothetical protein